MGNSMSYNMGKSRKKSVGIGEGLKIGEQCPTPTYPSFLQKFSEVLLEKSRKEEDSSNISCATFKKCLCKPYEPLGQKLFNYFLAQENEDPEKCLNEMSPDVFLSQSAALLACHTDFQQLEYYVKVFTSQNDEITYDEFYDLVTSAYEMAQFAHHSSSSPDDLLPAISKAVMHGKQKVNIPYALHWLCQHCPRIVMWMHRYLSHVLTVGYSTVPKNEDTEEDDNETPVLDSAASSSCVTLHPALIWMLSCTLPLNFIKSKSSVEHSPSNSNLMDPHKFIMNAMLGHTPTHWAPLYNSDNDGLSMNRFRHHVFDYHSPSLLFVTTEEAMFCVAVDEEWQDSKHFYGGVNCMCIQLLPKYQIIEKGNKLIYFNTTSRGFPMGFQIGIDPESRALSIDNNLKLVHYKRIPYKLLSLEVWGCGTPVAKEKQQEHKRQANRDVESRRKVKMNSNDWVDNPDRCLLEMAGARPTYAMYEKHSQNQITNT